MKKLEKQIISGIYDFEAKYTVTQILVRLILMTVMMVMVLLLLGLILDSLYQQGSLALLEIFFEDSEILKENIGNVWETLFYEAPWFEIIIAIIIFNLIIVTIIRILLKLRRIKNKISFLLRYWIENLYEKWKS